MQFKKQFYARISLLALAIFFSGCATKRVALAEGRPAYSRAEGESIRKPKEYNTPESFYTMKDIADTFLGIPYLYGGETREGIDCSAFTQQVFKESYAIDLPRRAVWQSELGLHVFKYALRKGDLVFFGENAEDIDHVGIYMGDGLFINATVSQGVKYSSLDEAFWLRKYQFARRISSDDAVDLSQGTY